MILERPVTVATAAPTFLTAMPAPPPQLPAVVPETPTIAEGGRALDTIALATWKAEMQTRDLRLALGVGGMLTGAFGSFACLIGASAWILEQAPGSFPLWSGVAAAVAFAVPLLGNPLLARVVEASLAKKVCAELVQAEEARTASRGVGRAWLDVRAAKALGPLVGGRDPLLKAFTAPIGALATGQRLAAFDEPASEASPDRAHALLLAEVYDIVRTRASGYLAGQLESVLAVIESLPAEARELVCDELSAEAALHLRDAANKWRLARFEQALAGKIEPYSDKPVDAGEGEPTVDELAKVRNGKNGELFTSAHAAARDIAARLVAFGAPVRIAVKDASVAAEVAAHFERRSYRAALYQLRDRTLVTVYAIATPPSGDFVEGRG